MDYEIIETRGSQVSIQGKMSALDKLPKDVGAGSDAILIDDSGSAHVYMFFKFLNDWMEVQ